MIVIFRSDASSDIGSGHIMRCLALAEELKANGWVCIFACVPETLEAVPLLALSSFETCSPEEVQTIRPDLLIVDHYGLDAGYERSVSKWCRKIAVIDDLANRPHDCDLLIDQTYGRAAEEYNGLVPDNCRVLTGSDYMLLRPQFSQAREKAKIRRKKNPSNRILIATGSTNYKNIVSKILRGFKGYKDYPFDIRVVLSSGAPQIDEVQHIIRDINAAGVHKTSIYLDVTDMAAMMVEVDIAVGAGGTTTWERCCLGLPTLMIELADNQTTTIEALRKVGAVIYAGHGNDLDAIKEIPENIQNVLSTPEKLHALTEASFRICDGLGLPRAALAIKEICCAGMMFRPAENVDSERLLSWRNDERTRASSINMNTVSPEDHDRWFENILRAESPRVFIAEDNGIPVGTIRRDENEGELYLSWTVNPDFRGRGIGEAMLSSFIRLQPAVYKALIKEENTASIHIAERCGFTRSGAFDGLLIFTYGG